jgi:hypothetical protein
VVIATVFLTIIGMTTGFVIGERQRSQEAQQQDQEQQQNQQPTQSSAPAPVIAPRPACWVSNTPASCAGCTGT